MKVGHLVLSVLLAAGCDDAASTVARDGRDPDFAGRPGLGDGVASASDGASDLRLIDGVAPAPEDLGGGGGEPGGAGDADRTSDADGLPVSPENTCAAVDILVVVDDSASMADNQVSLAASFPGFVDKLRERLAFSRSFHVGVVTSDDYWHNAAGCQNIGDLVTQTGGPESSNADCAPFQEGHRFMTEREPDLLASFSCAARVGSTGADDEKVMRALLNAVSAEKNAPGGCNEGFLRQDSLLVILILTDEDDVPDVCQSGTCQRC